MSSSPTDPCRSAVLGMVLLAVGLVAVGVAAAPAAADEHTYDEAADFTEEANFTINLPERTDHYPGDHPVHSEQNGYNASIEYFAAGEQAFRELDAEEGVFLDFIILEAGFIDYSECDETANTKAFGIDRGNNNTGTRTDEGLIQYRKSSELKPGGLTVDFYTFDDLSNDPPYMAPPDAIVAAQGVGSRDGPCLKMTSEPGWYRIQGFLNATAADNGPDEEPSEDARKAGIRVESNYVYICECDSEGEAREQLGPPPTEQSGEPNDENGSDATPTATAASESTPTPERTATATAQSADPAATPTPTPTAARSTDATGTVEPTATAATDGPAAQRRAAGIDRYTPTVAEGPGFTATGTLVALLAAASLLAGRA